MKPDMYAIRARWPRGRLANTDARDDVLALLAYVERLQEERDEARAEAKRRLDELNMVQSQLTLALHARDEARAEVQDYRVANQDAYRRGAEAMREACADMADGFSSGASAKDMRALPIPEGP